MGAGRADKAAFDAVMARVGHEPPRPGDEACPASSRASMVGTRPIR